MKRRKPTFSSSPLSSITPPTPCNSDTTLLTSTTKIHFKPNSTTSKRSLSQTLSAQPESEPDPKWVPLNWPKPELWLPLTFPTGQTFRWKKTGPLQYTGVVASHLVSLKHFNDYDHSGVGGGDGGDVSFCFHSVDGDDRDDSEKLSALRDFLNAGVSLTEMWADFAAADPRFAELAPRLAGARVLRQDPFECLLQFLCSSNNNIPRITKMVDFLSSLGPYLGTVEGFRFHRFPSLERLSLLSEQEFREAGFGYRAKYIVGTVKALQSKPGGGVEWLYSLRKLDLEEVIDALTTLPGVGPKVASCVALFSLDQHHAVPVDTHVWQVATRYLIPEFAGVRLTSKLCSRAAEAFVTRYGKYAGWAQTLLFVSELPSQKVIK